MSFLDRIVESNEEDAALARGDSTDFFRRTRSRHSSPMMVRPAGATWEYYPIDVRPDVSTERVESVLEDIDELARLILE